jgi:hypothetical protein
VRSSIGLDGGLGSRVARGRSRQRHWGTARLFEAVVRLGELLFVDGLTFEQFGVLRIEPINIVEECSDALVAGGERRIRGLQTIDVLQAEVVSIRWRLGSIPTDRYVGLYLRVSRSYRQANPGQQGDNRQRRRDDERGPMEHEARSRDWLTTPLWAV